MEAPNRNLLWAKVFVQELARSGLRAVCIAPGSRSTPLAIAFAEQPEITVYSLIDERSCAFFALGLALSSEQPVAMLCSSGTATANFYPAIIEAHYSGVPLLVLTADRSHELRDSGANQTVDQVKMYGDHVLWSVDVALPEAHPPAVVLRSLRTLANRAYATSNGMMGATVSGAVHLNFPFRKPLEPTFVETDLHEVADERGVVVPFTRISRGVLQPSHWQISEVEQALRRAKRGVIVCGVRHSGDTYHYIVSELARATRFPVFADPLSWARFDPVGVNVLGGYETFLRVGLWESPDLILHLGGMPTSQALDDYLNTASSEIRIAISADGRWSDANHLLTHFIVADPYTLCKRVATRLSAHPVSNLDENWLQRFFDAEAMTWEAVDQELQGEYFDGVVLADVVDLLPDHAMLYVASSLPVRHLDQFGRPNTKALRVFANRGASGIDGTISSALGAAASDPDVPLTLVTGDLAFYHDMNGLMAIKRLGLKATIVVINNDGGGIFHRLPVAKFDPPFTDLFVTPHGLNFEPAAQLYGLDYTIARDLSSFRKAFTSSLASQNSTIIEVPTNAEHDLARRNEIVSRVVERMKEHIQS